MIDLVHLQKPATQDEELLGSQARPVIQRVRVYLGWERTATKVSIICTSIYRQQLSAIS